MESTYDSGDRGLRSLKQAWQRCQHAFSASSVSAAWQSAKLAIDALPIWALVVFPVLAALLVVDRGLLIVPLAAVVFLFATYHTVKRAVADALKERR